MTLKDTHGHALSGATAPALDAFDAGTAELRCYVGDPLAQAQRACVLAPAMTMAHALVAWLQLLGTEPGGLAPARAALQAARALPADEREALHLAAIAQLLEGRWHAAARTLEDLSIRWPRDLLALQVGHQLDFFTGDSRMLRDRVARALPAWAPGTPGRHAVLGMLAFGLEECADYARAERLGREAAALEPRDSWAWHAVAHVMEMENRRHDGVAWLGAHSATWSTGSFLAVHNWWHLALFQLGLERMDEVLALLDARVLGGDSAVVQDMVDASALLWRLQLRGVPLGTRWDALAERWAAVVDAAPAGHYAFNDLHAMMAFVGAGRSADARRLAERLDADCAGAGDNAGFAGAVGRDAARAVLAFAHGDHGQAVRLLRPLRSRAHRFGGSHAQRDVIDLTLIEAAVRAGERALADALRAERSLRAA